MPWLLSMRALIWPKRPKPAITTCGSGVTAAILFLALTRLGKTDLSLYDGSWSEWGMYADLPIATGAA